MKHICFDQLIERFYFCLSGFANAGLLISVSNGFYQVLDIATVSKLQFEFTLKCEIQ